MRELLEVAAITAAVAFFAGGILGAAAMAVFLMHHYGDEDWR